MVRLYTPFLKGFSQSVRKSFTKVKRLSIHLDIHDVIHSDDRRRHSCFEGPYTVQVNGESVGEGKLLCYDKVDIAHELQRHFDFYCHAYL